MVGLVRDVCVLAKLCWNGVT